MVNRGVAPPDFSTPVGQFRAAYPDLTYEPLVPEETGYGDYAELSDVEIEGLLAISGGSINRSLGNYYLQLSGQAAKRSKTVKDYDLQVDLTKRAADLRAIAQMYFDQADAEDAAGAEDAFEIVPTVGCGDFVPEASIGIWGRRYVLDRKC